MPMSAMKACFINKEGRYDNHSTFTHYTIRTHALIVLAELHLVAHQWLYFLFKLSLAIAFKEIATSISKKARLNNEHAFNISLYYVHYINFNRFV